MRLSNKRKAPLYNFINTALIMFLVMGILAFFAEEMRFQLLGMEAYLFIAVPAMLIIIFYLNGRQIFEYDSDGEALHFRNRNIVPFMSTPLSDEFPKYKFVKFETFTFLFFKRLYITINSKSGNTILKYEISYLTWKELNDLKFSLNKVIKNNKEKVNDE
ncbi:hypothetical protein [Chryseobacterium caseinilyticum]|uniref:PH domain-containing protein n=1 Tax=Chryseobacterium caseinilyticum TaxID=2771428 RepID=A0ABR8Z9M1_9FLAO|nr:hypothetical protein [Chryseobacterium caseinilyticum]MBD8081942.1 hypothetical protein [Chryseobacterium caseinilyticum]